MSSVTGTPIDEDSYAIPPPEDNWQELQRREWAIVQTMKYFDLFEDVGHEEFQKILEKFYNFHKYGYWSE